MHHLPTGMADDVIEAFLPASSTGAMAAGRWVDSFHSHTHTPLNETRLPESA